MTSELDTFLSQLPLVAVLRGITPAEVEGVCGALFDEGFRIIEVPLNSPDAFASIAALARQLGTRCLVGAGTVMSPVDAGRVAEAGGRLIVMPHADVRVIAEARRLGLVCLPGVATVTEAFAAVAAGASGLKMFPAEQFAPAVLKAWRAVLPKAIRVLPVGGIKPESMAPWWAASADGFGTGSNLYAPGASVEQVRERARAYAAACAALPRR